MITMPRFSPISRMCPNKLKLPNLGKMTLGNDVRQVSCFDYIQQNGHLNYLHSSENIKYLTKSFCSFRESFVRHKFRLSPKRCFSAIIKPKEDAFIDRLAQHFSLSSEQNYLVMSNAYLNGLSKIHRQSFIDKFGSPDLIKTKPAQNNYLKKLIYRLCSLDPQRKNIRINSKWFYYPIVLNALAGLGGLEYSSPCAVYTAESLPIQLKNLYKDSLETYKPVVIEVGGFGFNNAFLFYQAFVKEKIYPSEYIGIDIYHPGIVTAKCFNDQVAKINSVSFIHDTADNALNKLSDTHGQVDKVVIALRFLAVLKKKEIVTFFHAVKRLMKKGDLLVLSYSYYDKLAKEIGRKEKFSLKEDHGVAYIGLKAGHVYSKVTSYEEEYNELQKLFKNDGGTKLPLSTIEDVYEGKGNEKKNDHRLQFQEDDSQLQMYFEENNGQKLPIYFDEDDVLGQTGQKDDGEVHLQTCFEPQIIKNLLRNFGFDPLESGKELLDPPYTKTVIAALKEPEVNDDNLF